MNLDSARELKAKLVAEVARPLVSAEKKSSARSRARRLPTMALGIAGKRGDYKLAIRIQRRSPEVEERVESFKKRAHGEVDIADIGAVVKYAAMMESDWHRQRQRPLVIGCSIGHSKGASGTLGFFVRDGDRRAIVSNNHVLADENRGKDGDPIIQPGRADGGQNANDHQVGRLRRFVTLVSGQINRVDAAVAHVDDGIGCDTAAMRGLSALQGVAHEVTLQTTVTKIGRTTGLTDGRINTIELDHVLVEYDMGNLRFDGQIEIEGTGTDRFSDNGDSGSLIVTNTGLAVALLFAGTKTADANGKWFTYGNPMSEVLQTLAVELLA